MTNPKEKMKERLRRKKHKQKLHLKELLALLNAENTVDVNDLYKVIEKKDKKKEEINDDVKEENDFKSECNKDTDLFSEQFALLIIAALGFIVAYTWNTFLNRCIENHVKNHILQHFIYVIGITIIATIIIYFIGKYLEI